MGKGSSSNSRKEWDMGFWVPGAFKLDHLQPLEPILLWQFFNFFTFILGSQFLLPQRANNGKGEFFQPKKVDETEEFQCLRHSNWTSCIPLNHFCSRNFPICFLSYWEANCYYPRGLTKGKGDSPNFRKEWDSGFSVLGTFKLDHLQSFKPILIW